MAKDTGGEGVPRLTLASLQTRLDEVEKLAKGPKPKDDWDKLGAISGFLSAALVAAVGFYATQVYTAGQKEAEGKIEERAIVSSELQTVEKFMPYFFDDEDKKRVALVAISALGNTDLAARLAESLGGEGAVAALAAISTSSQTSTQDRETVDQGLQGLLQSALRSLVKISVTTDDGALLQEVTGFAVAPGAVLTTVQVHSNGAAKYQVSQEAGPKYNASVIQSDEELVLLAVPAQMGLIPLTLSEVKPTAGANVVGLGYSAAAGTPLVISGRVTGADAKSFFLDVAASPGMGGSPILDEKGKVVAILKGSIAMSGNPTGIVVAVPAAFAKSLVALVQ